MSGKGDSPRNCFSKQFKNNFDDINWGHARSIDSMCSSPKESFKKSLKEQEEELSELEQNRKDRIKNK